MDNNKLERLIAMEAEIGKLKMNISWWEKVDDIKELVCKDSNGKTVCVDHCYVDVAKLKAETLYHIKNKLAKLEKEFKEA